MVNISAQDPTDSVRITASFNDGRDFATAEKAGDKMNPWMCLTHVS